ncbi:Ribonuclease 3-like protein 2 [Acorus gramineus]|uniref:Ribonuclease 3-like protein 2 n=1 Tax=Acorus gramineus TaxID=55184 RepID=A0AAV8ZZB9_ACOGR|nr:Ribonuclease 3-like protein 2 [Acorus gramineus]
MFNAVPICSGLVLAPPPPQPMVMAVPAATLKAASPEMAKEVAAVEALLRYKFKDETLLEEALTHSSCAESASYQRLEFIGDAALGLAISNYLYLNNPDVGPGRLSALRAANVSTEKLARVAVRHGLYRFLRRNSPSLDEKVREFTVAIEREGDEQPYCSIKAPKVLSDIVESIAAAIYVDCHFNLEQLWMTFRGLLEPVIMSETFHEQPVTALYEFCQKYGMAVDIRNWKKGDKNITNVFVEKKLVGVGCSEQKEIAKLNAAKDALEKLSASNAVTVEVGEVVVPPSVAVDNKEYKQALNGFCSKKHWPKPTYRVDKEQGPPHDRQFRCSVQVETADGVFIVAGEFRSRVKDAENSAASHMLINLRS